MQKTSNSISIKEKTKKFLNIIVIILSSLTFLEMLGHNITGLAFLRDHITMFIVSILFLTSVVLYILGMFVVSKYVVSILGCIGSWVFYILMYMLIDFVHIYLVTIWSGSRMGMSVWPIAGILEIISLYLSKKKINKNMIFKGGNNAKKDIKFYWRQ